MPLVYAASDVVVSASSAQPEAFGRVIPEAQAMGRIVVGTAHGGACETISDGETGFLVPPGDPLALAAALDRALSMSPEESRRMSDAAVASVRENFSMRRMCERTIAVYRQIQC
jgi:glycosyltransferase involved in cell wall biosynthesis